MTNPFIYLKYSLITGLFLSASAAAIAQTWVGVGIPGISTGSINYTSIVLDTGGIPYIAFADALHGNNASVMKYTGSAWTYVGDTSISSGLGAWSVTLAFGKNDTPYIAYNDVSSDGAPTIMKYNGTSWVQVGSTGSPSGPISSVQLAIDTAGTPYVAYQDPTEYASVKKFDGSNWVFVGSPSFSAGYAATPSIALDPSGTPYVSYTDGANAYKVSVMKYNGSAWENVGPAGFTPDSAGVWEYSLAIDGSGTPYIAYQDDNDLLGKAIVMKYDGTSWTELGGTPASPGAALWISLALNASGEPYIVYADGTDNNKATVVTYHDSSWVTTGAADFSDSSVKYASIAMSKSGASYVVYKDAAHVNKVTVKELQTSNTVAAISHSAPGLNVYPDPAQGNFFLTVSTSQLQSVPVVITNALGQKVKECTIPANNARQITLDVAPGVYFISAITNDGVATKSIIVK